MIEAKRLAGRTLGEAARLTFFTEVIHTQNLEITRKHLQNGGSAIIVSNHFDEKDSVVVGKTLIDNALPLNDKVYIFVAQKFLDASRNESKGAGRLLRTLAEGYGFTLLPIVQDKPEEHQLNPGFQIANGRSVITAVKALREPGNVVCITPEGTRSKTGKLLKAQEGLELLFRSKADVLIQPLAIIPTHIAPLKGRTRILVPEPVTFAELERERLAYPDVSLTDLAMLRIARELPVKFQGAYRSLVERTSAV